MFSIGYVIYDIGSPYDISSLGLLTEEDIIKEAESLQDEDEDEGEGEDSDEIDLDYAIQMLAERNQVVIEIYSPTPLAPLAG